MNFSFVAKNVNGRQNEQIEMPNCCFVSLVIGSFLWGGDLSTIPEGGVRNCAKKYLVGCTKLILFMPKVGNIILQKLTMPSIIYVHTQIP